MPYRGERTPIVILVLAGSEGGYPDGLDLLDPRLFRMSILFAEYYDLSTPLPPHSVIFNAIGDADLSVAALAAAAWVLDASTAPVLNAPAAVARTGRGNSTPLFGDIPGLTDIGRDHGEAGTGNAGRRTGTALERLRVSPAGANARVPTGATSCGLRRRRSYPRH